MIVGLDGLGAVGRRCVRELLATPAVEAVVVRTSQPRRLDAVIDALGPRVRRWDDSDHVDVVVLSGDELHARAARHHLEEGRHVVSTSDDPDEVQALLNLDALARSRNLMLVVGVACSPGMSCLLARHASMALDEVLQIRVAMYGAGGPACGRRRDDALDGTGVIWRGGEAVSEESGSELTWFPDPVGAEDCSFAHLVEPLLLRRTFPNVPNLSARAGMPVARRLLDRLPWVHPRTEDSLGAVRVEVSGRRDGEDQMLVYAVVDRPAHVAAAVVAVVVGEMVTPTPGAWGVGQHDEPVRLLHALAHRGVKAATFEPAV